MRPQIFRIAQGLSCITLRLVLTAAALALPGSTEARAEKRWEFGGFLDSSAQVFIRRPNEADAQAIGTERFQIWSRARLNSRVSWRARMDFRLDSHRDIDRRRWFDLTQRGLQRPAGQVSELYLDARLGRVDLRLGRQEIRWGRADGFNPTDNLIPYDYLNTFIDERLGVPALKADFYAGRARFEAAWIPFYTPTRLPLLGQRWFPRLPESTSFSLSPDTPPVKLWLNYRDGGGAFPARTLGHGQWGVRWNQLISGAEFSISYFDGIDDIPYFRVDSNLISTPQPRALVTLHREYYRLRVAGADFASQLGPVGLRGEMAWFDRCDPGDLDHLLFVVGADRAWGDWFAILQYAGQKLGSDLQGAAQFPELGLRSTLLARIERTLGPARSLEIKGALRVRDGDFLLQPLYSTAVSSHWRFQIGATLFGGAKDGYLGQFRDNSHLFLELRCTY